MNSDFKYWWFRIVVSVILLMAGVMPVYCAMVGKQEVQGALDILDMELQHSDLYMQRRASKIDSVSDEEVRTLFVGAIEAYYGAWRLLLGLSH